jgi:hypothetical protein
MTHSSRCFGWGGVVPTFFLPRPSPGIQRPIAKGAAVASGLAWRRNNVIVWSSLDDNVANQGAVLTFVHPSGNVSVSANGFGRYYPAEDGTDVLVTSLGGSTVWIEDPSSMEAKDT